MKEIIYAEFLPKYNAFGVKDEIIEAVSARGNVPEIYLRAADLNILAPDSVATAAKPTTAFLMGR